MAKTTFYYAVRTYGDGNKGVNIYRIQKGKLVSVGDVEVSWGNDCEMAVERYIKDNEISKNFYTEEL